MRADYGVARRRRPLERSGRARGQTSTEALVNMSPIPRTVRMKRGQSGSGSILRRRWEMRRAAERSNGSQPGRWARSSNSSRLNVLFGWRTNTLSRANAIAVGRTSRPSACVNCAAATFRAKFAVHTVWTSRPGNTAVRAGRIAERFGLDGDVRGESGNFKRLTRSATSDEKPQSGSRPFHAGSVPTVWAMREPGRVTPARPGPGAHATLGSISRRFD